MNIVFEIFGRSLNISFNKIHNAKCAGMANEATPIKKKDKCDRCGDKLDGNTMAGDFYYNGKHLCTSCYDFERIMNDSSGGLR